VIVFYTTSVDATLQGDRCIAFGRVDMTRAVQLFGGIVGGLPFVNAGQRLSYCFPTVCGAFLQGGRV